MSNDPHKTEQGEMTGGDHRLEKACWSLPKLMAPVLRAVFTEEGAGSLGGYVWGYVGVGGKNIYSQQVAKK